ncbi:hypothetical protein VspSTUT16_27490 [Vibrio sp. STUT-A16]|nr:hypothetical protein VspSTUT16_27490 [Vibrio sp. STUT-A16]
MIQDLLYEYFVVKGISIYPQRADIRFLVSRRLAGMTLQEMLGDRHSPYDGLSTIIPCLT